MQASSLLPVAGDVLINALMADPHIFLSSQPAADLFGTPVFLYEIIDNTPNLFRDFRLHLFTAAIVSHLLRLSGTISTKTTIAS